MKKSELLHEGYINGLRDALRIINEQIEQHDYAVLKDGSNMFEDRKDLTSWNIPLPTLETAKQMFSGSGLTQWTVDLPNLKNGCYMFSNCHDLETFSADLSNLTDGFGMFYDTQLSSFSGSLANLDKGSDMFLYCSLDLPSLQNIANTIKTHTDEGEHEITLGLACSELDYYSKRFATWRAAVDIIEEKGWETDLQFSDWD